MNLLIKKLLPVIVACSSLFGSRVSALTLNAADAFFLNQPSEPNLAALLAGVPGSVAANFATTLYKNSSGTETGSLTANYTTTYTLPPDGGTATITWDGGAFANATYLMAKDGNMGIYIWDISSWNGMDTLVIPNPWLALQGKSKTYSHVTIWGSVGTSVPDSGTTALLVGLGFAGMSLIARRRNS